MYILENWSMVFTDPWAAPEMQIPQLHGKVYGHPKFDDGESITTSAIDGFDKESNAVVTRSGSKYCLGHVDSEYEEIYPDAYNRLINSLIENGE